MVQKIIKLSDQAVINGNGGILIYEDNIYDLEDHQCLNIYSRIKKINYIGYDKKGNYTLWKNKMNWKAEKRIWSKLRIIYVGNNDQLTLLRLNEIEDLMRLDNVEYLLNKNHPMQ